MTGFEMKVLEAVRTNPGMRARDLPLNAWVVDVATTLWKLEQRGLVRAELVQRESIIEAHYIWYRC